MRTLSLGVHTGSDLFEFTDPDPKKIPGSGSTALHTDSSQKTDEGATLNPKLFGETGDGSNE